MLLYNEPITRISASKRAQTKISTAPRTHLNKYDCFIFHDERLDVWLPIISLL